MKEIQTRFPPRTQRIPAYRTHQEHAGQFRDGGKVRRKVQICFSTILTRPRKRRSLWTPFAATSNGWGIIGRREVYASDFFDEIYGYAEKLIEDGKAFVCDLSPEEISATRGTLTEAGTESPYRNRSVEENLRLFREMKAGKYADGEKCNLRAKNRHVLAQYEPARPRHLSDFARDASRTGDKWCIYMYYAHPICDYLQGVTHSLYARILRITDLCTTVGINLGFQTAPNRVRAAGGHEYGHVKTLPEKAGRGGACPRLGRSENADDCGTEKPRRAARSAPGFLRQNRDRQGEFGMSALVSRSVYPRRSQRERGTRHGGFEPLKVTISNYEGTEELETPLHPVEARTGNAESDVSERYRQGPDFSSDPPPKYQRLKPNGYVRLKNAYIVHCDEVIEDGNGKVKELVCSYIPESRSSRDTSGIKVKRGTIQWVDAATGVDAEIRQYSYLLKRRGISGTGLFRAHESRQRAHFPKAKRNPISLKRKTEKRSSS